MARNRALIFLVGALGLSFSTAGHAATVDLNYDLQTVYTSETGVRANTATYNRDLVGMTVSATFTDGGSGSWSWGQRNPYNPWSLGLLGAPSHLGLAYGPNMFALGVEQRIESLDINLAGANAIFDAGGYGNSDPRNSPTTSSGIEFDVLFGLAGLDGEIGATYGDHVQIGDHLTGEDSFARLSLDFSGLDGGGFLGNLLWRNDIDVLASDGQLAAVTPIPLPAGMGLLFAGLGALGAVRRRKLR